MADVTGNPLLDFSTSIIGIATGGNNPLPPGSVDQLPEGVCPPGYQRRGRTGICDPIPGYAASPPTSPAPVSSGEPVILPQLPTPAPVAPAPQPSVPISQTTGQPATPGWLGMVFGYGYRVGQKLSKAARKRLAALTGGAAALPTLTKSAEAYERDAARRKAASNAEAMARRKAAERVYRDPLIRPKAMGQVDMPGRATARAAATRTAAKGLGRFLPYVGWASVAVELGLYAYGLYQKRQPKPKKFKLGKPVKVPRDANRKPARPQLLPIGPARPGGALPRGAARAPTRAPGSGDLLPIVLPDRIALGVFTPTARRVPGGTTGTRRPSPRAPAVPISRPAARPATGLKIPGAELLPWLLALGGRGASSPAALAMPAVTGLPLPAPMTTPPAPITNIFDLTAPRSGGVGSTPNKGKRCECAKKPRKPRAPRATCYTGTYTETAKGLIKKRREQVQCR